MKKIIFIGIIFILTFGLFSCIDINILLPDNPNNNDKSGDFYRYLYTMYNKGGTSDFNTIKTSADNPSYTNDDNVLEFYKYFKGEISLIQLGTRLPFDDTDMHYDERIQNYMLNYYDNYAKNNSNTDWFIDHFDEEVPVNPSNTDKNFDYLNISLITEYTGRTALVQRVYDLIKRDYVSTSSYVFGEWFRHYFPNKTLTDSEILKYAQYITDICYTYTNSGLDVPVLKQSSSDLWNQGNYGLKFENISAEYLLALMYQESRFFPGSYRAEGINNIDAVSFGLTHNLIDADYLYIANGTDIGNSTKDRRNFMIISEFYFGNTSATEDYFSDWDLMTVRGSVLYTLIYSELCYRKLSFSM